MRNEVIVRKMAGCVSKVLGYCEGVNLRLVWEIISEDLPEVQKILDRMI